VPGNSAALAVKAFHCQDLRTQARVLVGTAGRYVPFWIGGLSGALAWLGVVMPPVIMGTHSVGAI